MNATFWALVPPLLAIIVSLITKEVNFSLLIGIIVGAGLFTHFDGFAMVTTMFDVIGDKVHGNIGVLIFIIDPPSNANVFGNLAAEFTNVHESGPYTSFKRLTLNGMSTILLMLPSELCFKSE